MPITPQQIDAILSFLDRFEAKGFSAGSLCGRKGEMPYFEYDEAIAEFQTALYDNGWIDSSFNWPDWQDSAVQFVENPTQLETANAATIQKLLTTHVRKERFCEGHLGAMFENGHISALLRRLKQIRQSPKYHP